MQQEQPIRRPPGAPPIKMASPLGPAPSDPLGRPVEVIEATAARRAAEVWDHPAPQEPTDPVFAELRAIRNAVVGIKNMLTWMFVGVLFWIALVGGCRQIVEQQRFERQRSLERLGY